MNELPDPVQIIAASLRRYIPDVGSGAEPVAEVIVRELQRNGWLAEWEPIRVHGVAA